MTLFIQDVFAEAKALGLTEGFVGSYADLKQLLFEATEPVDPDEDGEKAWLAWAEGGWHGGQFDDLAEDQAHSPFDPIWAAAPIEEVGFLINGVKVVKPDFNAENDPDGEAENAWHEQLGEQWAEGRASNWFAFPGDRH